MANPEAQAFICVTCGTQCAPSVQPPSQCAICIDPRQYVGLDGQRWITLEELRESHRNKLMLEEPNLHSISTEPSFGIGQRAFLLQTAAGNILWDCIALLDQPTVDAIRQVGGIQGIAISHPHYYTTMIEWSATFDNAPIYLHTADREWVMRQAGENVHFWSGETLALPGGLTLIRTPGHYDGFQVLHWPDAASGKGVLFSGDQPQVCLDLQWLSFMYSYPNLIPLDVKSVKDIARRLEPWTFDRIYGAFPRRTVAANAKARLEASVQRYINAIEGQNA